MKNEDKYMEQNPTTEEIAQRLKEELQAEPGNVPNMAGIFYDHFKKEEREPKAQDPVTFAPSYLNNCRRQTYYKKTGETPSNPITTPAYLKMDMGTTIHERLQGILKEKGILESSEEHKQIEYQGLTFNYFYDGIINWQNQRYLIEIKTVYARGFDFIEYSPKEDHILQAISYMVFENLPRCIIIYIGRDNGLIRQHYLELKNAPYSQDQALYINGDIPLSMGLIDWQRKITALKGLKRMIESKRLPDRDYQIVLKNLNGVIKDSFTKDKVKYKTDWQCSYCAFKSKCWEKELKQIETKSFYINGKFE